MLYKYIVVHVLCDVFSVIKESVFKSIASAITFGVRSGMAESMDIPLPELTVENFKRAWTRFELVAKAKEWNAAKQLIVLPTLLRGKLVDYYSFD